MAYSHGKANRDKRARWGTAEEHFTRFNRLNARSDGGRALDKYLRRVGIDRLKRLAGET